MIVRIVNPGAYLDIRHATRADRGATISARFRSTPRSTSWASGPAWYSLPSILARAAAFAPVSVCGRSGLTRPSSGVSTKPGQTALTLTPRLAPSARSDRLSPTTACLAAAYGAGLGPGPQPAHGGGGKVAPRAVPPPH